MIEDYAKAVLPEPYIVLGRRLTHYTIGHHVCLTRIESPILQGGDVMLTAADVILGTMICSQTWRENQDMLAWDMDEAIRRFMHRDLFWWWSIRRIDWKRTIAMFIEWYQGASAIPVTYTEAGAKSASAPWIETTYAILAKHFAYTFDETMDMPIGLAVYRTIAVTEGHGGTTRLETDDERDLRMMQ